MKIVFILLFCVSYLTLAKERSICSEIVEHRKKQFGVNNYDFKKSIQKLKSTIHDDCIIVLLPKYYWAQNMSFIMVKFDFQLSSRTSCAQLLFSEKNVTYHGFTIKQFCLQSQQVIKYQINVKTYKNLNPHFVNWKTIQMNGVILEALKSPTPYFWPKLYSKNQPISHKPKVWWQLQQKQDTSVQQYMNLLQIDQQEVEISSYVKKVNKNRKKKFKRKPSDIQFYCNQGSPYFLGSWF